MPAATVSDSHLSLYVGPEEAPAAPETAPRPETALFEDAPDAASARTMERLERAGEGVRRAHAMDQADEDLMPKL